MTSSVYRVLHECGGVLPSFTVFFSGSDPTLLSLIDFYWVLPSFTEFFLALIGVGTGFIDLAMSVVAFYRVLLGFQRF